MATVRYVILVPREVEADVIGNDDMVSEWGKQIAESYEPVHSMHPRQDGPYTAKMLEAVRLDEPEGSEILEDLVAPGMLA